jgi:uncharacterized membrane protein
MTTLYTRIFALGAISGLRAMLGPALAAEGASDSVKLLFRVLSAGELIGDKLPKTPSRLDPGPLFGRAVAGAAVGYVLCRRAGQSPWLGTALGAGAALVGAYGGCHGRRLLGETLHIPDAVVAVGEDALAIGVGRHVSR